MNSVYATGLVAKILAVVVPVVGLWWVWKMKKKGKMSNKKFWVQLLGGIFVGLLIIAIISQPLSDFFRNILMGMK